MRDRQRIPVATLVLCLVVGGILKAVQGRGLSGWQMLSVVLVVTLLMTLVVLVRMRLARVTISSDRS